VAAELFAEGNRVRDDLRDSLLHETVEDLLLYASVTVRVAAAAAGRGGASSVGGGGTGALAYTLGVIVLHLPRRRGAASTYGSAIETSASHILGLSTGVIQRQRAAEARARWRLAKWVGGGGGGGIRGDLLAESCGGRRPPRIYRTKREEVGAVWYLPVTSPARRRVEVGVVVGTEGRELVWVLAPAACPGSWRSHPPRRRATAHGSAAGVSAGGGAEGPSSIRFENRFPANRRRRRPEGAPTRPRSMIDGRCRCGAGGSGGWRPQGSGRPVWWGAFFLSATTGDWTDH
jgi:hypothetical protein